MCRFREHSSWDFPLRTHKISGTLVLAAMFCVLAPASLLAADVSNQVSVTHTGFGRNRATNMWSATMTVTNKSASPIAGPIEVDLTNLSSNATMMNKTGIHNGSPYITVSDGTLAVGASVTVPIKFTNSTNDFITFTPVTYSGARP